MNSSRSEIGNLGTKRLFFLPGAGADPGFWRPLGDRLPADWRKTYFGWPGIGNQPPRAGVTGFDDLVAMVGAEIGEEPVDLLAQSMGGAIALRVALNHPTKVRRLVLTATSGGIVVNKLGAVDWRPAYRSEYPNAAAWITEVRPDFSPELPQITQPTLLLWGDADPISPIAVGEKLHSLLPNSTLRIVPGGDHGFVFERAGEIAGMIAEHLGGES